MLSRLVLTDYRNHAALTLAPGAGLVVLTGENGAGKTNVLEAVSLLAPGRGLRRAALGQIARADGPGGFGVAATLLPSRLREGLSVEGTGQALPQPLPQAGGEIRQPLPQAGGEIGQPLPQAGGEMRQPLPQAGGEMRQPLPHAGSEMRQPLPQVQAELQIATGTRADAPERRVLRIQGAPAATTALAEWLSVLWLTPAMDRLFVESAGGRRRFLDRLVLALDPSHARHAQRYDAAMRARNRLLADLRSADPSWLAALEAQLADHGAAVDAARRETVALLDARLSCAEPGPFARAQIAIEGWEGDDVPLAEALRRGRARDAAAGRTLAGPHRSDLQVVHRDKQQAAALASTGEQKALLLGIVLAHAELVATRTGQPPVLLLDEVAAHLDPRRRGALFERLQDGGQTWMTGTEDALFAQIGSATRVRLG